MSALIIAEGESQKMKKFGYVPWCRFWDVSVLNMSCGWCPDVKNASPDFLSLGEAFLNSYLC
jgi:hypothetical protein